MSETLHQSFWEFSREALGAQLIKLGVSSAHIKMRVAQIWRGVYIEGAKDFSQITTLSKDLRELLDAHFSLARPKIVRCQQAADETRKWLLQMHDGRLVEMVFIPEEKRGTLCLSSQIGCTLTCRFCYTGTQRFDRNLSAGEMVGQLITAFDALDAWGKPEPCLITNIVLMGQGEPLFNLDAVIAAIRIFCDGDGVAFSRRRVTVSTAGVVPAIQKLGEAVGVRLAISLHATNDALRTQLMPLNKKYNLASLLQACRDYPGHSNAHRITFEYVMLDGVNDSDADAHALANLLKGISAKINLIPFNPWPKSEFRTSPAARIKRFAAITQRAGFATPIRRARGEDIMAACGQLKSEVQPDGA